MVKGILKRFNAPRSAPSDIPDHDHDHDHSPKKRVSFDGAAKVFQADEWDRSPAAVTLKLTYKDVVELRELNISLVSPGPLAMVRTPSKRPTKQRTPRSPGSASSSPSSSSDTPASPASPSPSASSFFSPRHLGPLLEDPTAKASSPDSPPGLPTPVLRAINSPTLPPPSPLLLSSSRPPSPAPTPAVPLYRHPRHSSRLGVQRATLSPVSDNAPIVLPALAKAATHANGNDATVNDLKMKMDKLVVTDEEESEEDHDEDWKSEGLVSKVNGNEEVHGVPPTPPPTPRKPTRTLMGMWDFKKGSMGMGFGRVRSQRV